ELRVSVSGTVGHQAASDMVSLTGGAACAVSRWSQRIVSLPPRPRGRARVMAASFALARFTMSDKWPSRDRTRHLNGHLLSGTTARGWTHRQCAFSQYANHPPHPCHRGPAGNRNHSAPSSASAPVLQSVCYRATATESTELQSVCYRATELQCLALPLARPLVLTYHL